MSNWIVYEVANCDGEPPIAWQCAECGEVVDTKWKYCPECGDPKTTEGMNLETLLKALEAEHKKLREMRKELPEIIHCKDCIHNKEPEFGFCEWANHHVSANSCCADVFHAERRTDG